MARRWIFPAVVMVGLGVPGVAGAEGRLDCPPGGWFCEDLPGLGSDDDWAEPLDEIEPAPPPRRPRARPAPRRRPPPPPPGRVRAYPGEPPPPRPRKHAPPQLGLQFRFQSALMDARRSPEAKMIGMGLSLRPRPTPSFALDIGFDALTGTDYNGDPRSEGALSFSPMVFLNPKDKAQVYLLAGFGFAGATVDLPDGNIAHYSYAGVHGGVGLEVRLSPTVALDFDLLGFVRGRVDDEAARTPEFVDWETGRVTNTSGGGLARMGVAFYW